LCLFLFNLFIVLLISIIMSTLRVFLLCPFYIFMFYYFCTLKQFLNFYCVLSQIPTCRSCIYEFLLNSIAVLKFLLCSIADSDLSELWLKNFFCFLLQFMNFYTDLILIKTACKCLSCCYILTFTR